MGLLILLAFLVVVPSASAAAPTCFPVNLGTITRNAEPIIESPNCNGAFDRIEVTQAAHGTAQVLWGTSFMYEPDETYVGQDQFKYVAINSLGQRSAEQPVTVIVTNDGPECGSDVARIRQDRRASVLAPCFDPDLDPLTLVVLRPPAHGSLEANGIELEYDPVDGFRGYDSLEARASDGVAWSEPFELTILVTRNHAPRCDPETVHTGVGRPADVFVASACSDPDLQDQDLAIAVKAGSGPAAGNTLSELNEGQLVYTPGGSFTGADGFDITASDGNLTTQARQRLHVADTAFCSPEPAVQVRPGASHEFVPDCTLPPGVTATMNLALVQQASKGTVTKTADGFRYTANAGASGTDSFSFKAGAEGVFGPPAVQPIAIDAAANQPLRCDDPPGAQVVYAGRTQTLLPPCTDPDGDPLTYEPAGAPPHGTLVAENGLLRYSASAGHVGFDIVSYRVTDGRSPAQGPFEYPVEARAPQVPECFPLAALQLRPQRSVTFATNCTNPQGDPQTYQIVSSPTKGTLAATDVPGQFTYRSGTEIGDDSLQIRATNAVGPSAPVIIGVQINDNFNSAPVCASPGVPFKVARGTTTPLPLADHCTDVDDDELTFTLRDRPENGTVTPGPAASLSYEAGQELVGEVFSFVATDRRGAESEVTSFEVEVVDSVAPTCEEQPTKLVPAGATVTIELSCADPNLGALTYDIVRPPAAGTLSPDGTSTQASRTYTAPALTGPDQFTYSVRSAGGESDHYTQDIQVTAPDTPPGGGGATTSSGTTTTGGATVTPPDDQPPSLKAAPTGTKKLAGVRTGGLRVRFSCGESCTVYFELMLDKATARRLKVAPRAKSAVRIGSATASATSATVAVKLTAKARRAFKKARSVTVTLRGSAEDASGNVCVLAPKVLTLKK